MNEPKPNLQARAGLIAGATLMVIGCLIFAWRGPVHAVRHGGNYDFVLVYSASRAWIHGGNPYEPEAVSRAWATSGGPADRDPMLVRGAGTLVYPPPGLVVMAPVAALPWPLASWAWAALNTGLAAWALFSIARLAGMTGALRLAYFGIGLCMMPLLTTAGTGQTALVVLASVAAGCCVQQRGRSTAAGILLGIGGAMKPQLGFLFTVYQAGRQRWKTALISLAVVLLLSGIGMGRMQAAGADWWPSWRRNIAAFTTVDDGNPSRTNSIRYQLINLSYPLHNFTDDREMVRLSVYAIAGALCAAYFLVDLRRGRAKGEARGELISLSMVCAITLMAVYHRLYDAALLVIPLTLAMRGIASGQKRHWITFALVLLYAAPLPVLAVEAAKRGWAPSWISQSPIGENLILPCHAWGLVVLACWLIYLRWREPVTRIST